MARSGRVVATTTTYAPTVAIVVELGSIVEGMPHGRRGRYRAGATTLVRCALPAAGSVLAARLARRAAHERLEHARALVVAMIDDIGKVRGDEGPFAVDEGNLVRRAAGPVKAQPQRQPAGAHRSDALVAGHGPHPSLLLFPRGVALEPFGHRRASHVSAGLVVVHGGCSRRCAWPRRERRGHAAGGQIWMSSAA